MEEHDVDLAAKALQGQREAFAILVDRYKKPIYNLAYRLTGNREEAEEIAQEAFLRAFRSLAQYRPAYKFSTWLYRIATNIAIDRLRRRKEPPVSLDEPIGQESGQPREITDTSFMPEGIVARQERVREVQQAVAALPPMYRTVVILAHYHELSYQEIAKAIHKPVTVVKNRLYRARLMLKEQLRNLWEEG